MIQLTLREVRRASYFVGLLKNRYGWHIRPNAGSDDDSNKKLRRNLEIAKEDFPWLGAWEDRSVTEMEILEGVLLKRDDPKTRANTLFYFAGAELMRREAAGAAGGGEGPYAASRLEALKEEIRRTGLPVAEFEAAEPLAHALRDALEARIVRDYPVRGPQSWLDGERLSHAAFAALRQRVFVRDPEDARALGSYAAASGPELLLLHGHGGCGKSALLANWARDWAAGHPDDLTVVHFIGGSHSSSFLPSIARRVSEEVTARWAGVEGIETSGDDAAVATRLVAFLARGAREWPGRLVLVLDALDQLQGDAAAVGLAWLPPAAGPRLRLLLSTLPGPRLEAARGEGRACVEVEVRPLEEGRRRLVLEGVLKEQGRALSREHSDRIVRAAPSGNALFLTVLLEELSSASVHANLDADIDELLACGEPRALFARLLQRLAARYWRPLVRDAAAALVCARHGMAESELAAFLRVAAPDGPEELTWSSLWFNLLTLLVCRDGLYTFFHRCAAEAAESEFGLAGEASAARRETHDRLGAFFATQPPSQRRADEAPWALARAGPAASERLAALLSEGDVLRRVERFEMAGLWLKSGRAGEAAGRYAAALGLGGAEASLEELRRAGASSAT
eukprot:tig00021037_g17428.t1